MSLTDRNLRTSSDEAPQVRSRRRWVLPAAGAAILLVGGIVAGVHFLGDREAATPPAPTVSAGPSAQEVQAAKDAAWTSVQTWDKLSSQATAANSFNGIDASAVARPETVQQTQKFIDGLVAVGAHSAGENKLTLVFSEYQAASPDAFAPARVELSVCLDSSDVKVLDAAGNNVRVGPDGTTNFATRYMVNFWVWNTDGKWLTDAGDRTEQPC